MLALWTGCSELCLSFLCFPSILYSFLLPSLVPRLCPTFCCLQYGKAGRAWYLFSHEHEVIDKWPKNSERKSAVSHIVQPFTSSTLGVYNSRPPLATYVWCVTWYLSSSCCSELQCSHVQLSLFYHLSTLDVMHVRKDTRPSAFFVQTKIGAGLGTRLRVTSLLEVPR